jgi:hypothetical protein
MTIPRAFAAVLITLATACVALACDGFNRDLATPAHQNTSPTVDGSPSLDTIGRSTSAPAHINTSPTVDSGLPQLHDLANPAHVNQSPSPNGT